MYISSIQVLFSVICITVGICVAFSLIEISNEHGLITNFLKQKAKTHSIGKKAQEATEAIISSLMFYMSNKKPIVFRSILDTLAKIKSEKDFKDNKFFENIISQLWPLFQDESLLSSGQEFKIFIDKYMGLLSFSEDFDFFSNKTKDLLSYASPWLNQSNPQLKERAGNLVSKFPSFIIRANVFFKEEKNLQELKNTIIQLMFANIILMMKNKIIQGLQETVINIINTLDDTIGKEFQLDEESFKQIFSSTNGTIRIYLSDYAVNDTDKLIRENLRVLNINLLETTIKMNLSGIKVIEQIALHNSLADDEDDDDKIFWLSDLEGLTKYAKQANNTEVLAYIITLWKKALSGKESNFAKYLISDYKLDTIPEIKNLIQ